MAYCIRGTEINPRANVWQRCLICGEVPDEGKADPGRLEAVQLVEDGKEAAADDAGVPIHRAAAEGHGQLALGPPEDDQRC